LKGFAVDDVGIFMPILSIFRPNGLFYGHLVQFVVIWYLFYPFWYVVLRKIWQPCAMGHNKRATDGACRQLTF
jgi:hypothetical protein